VSLPAEHGLTKRERFCLEMGVADTGDAELDAIIRAGNRQRHAAMAMQGLLASSAHRVSAPFSLAPDAVDCADALLAKLEEIS
jgi:hypothetical protein